MLFYYDLLDSTIGVTSSLFDIVNSIRPFCIFKSRLSLIVRVNVVLNRTVVVDSD